MEGRSKGARSVIKMLIKENTNVTITMLSNEYKMFLRGNILYSFDNIVIVTLYTAPDNVL